MANFSSGNGIDSSTRYALRPGPQTTTLLRSSAVKSLMERVNTQSFLPARVLVAEASALAPMPMPAAAKTAANNKVFFMMRTPIVCTTSE